MGEKIGPKSDRFEFDEMDDDELLGWWIFYKMDDGSMNDPLHVISTIKKFKELHREGVIMDLYIAYN